MALIKCNHCGKMVSDRAAKCPHCGNDPKEEVQAPQANTPTVNNSDNAPQETAQAPQANTPNSKVLPPTEEQSSSGEYIIPLVIVFVILIMFAGIIGFVVFGSRTNKTDALPEDTVTCDSVVSDSLVEDNAEAESEAQEEWIGTFTFRDKQGHDWILTVNNDETATIKTKEGTACAYASWYKYDHMKHAQFRCSDKEPMIAFPGSEIYIKDNGLYAPDGCAYFCIDGKYIYYNSTAADAKNPEMRLPLSRVSRAATEVSDDNANASSVSYDGGSSAEQQPAREEGFRSNRDVMDFVAGNSYTHNGVTLRVTEDGVFANDNRISESRPVFRKISKENGKITARPSISITVKRGDNKLVDDKSGDVYYCDDNINA